MADVTDVMAGDGGRDTGFQCPLRHFDELHRLFVHVTDGDGDAGISHVSVHFHDEIESHNLPIPQNGLG